jgi:ATP-dependent DNA helicase DinG
VEPETLEVASEFDYASNALLYLPHDLPDPARDGYDAEALAGAYLPVLEASGGRAFLLFTSHRALREARPLIADRLDLPLFVQGEAPRTRLLEGFRASGNGILMGTRSFWEGVDVAGEALSVVVIDRLPFESPGDPVFRMRERALREAGRNPFMDWQLPTAVITLKQGAGRLIRNETDRGVLVLCDPRIKTKPYGRLFLKSLPPMRRTRDLEQVREFFK